jgi:hypothetical protein
LKGKNGLFLKKIAVETSSFNGCGCRTDIFLIPIKVHYLYGKNKRRNKIFENYTPKTGYYSLDQAGKPFYKLACGPFARLEPAEKEREQMEKENASGKQKPDKERMAVLRSLPIEIKEQITGEEARAFLYNEELPDTLLEKLRDYLVPEEER